MASADVTAFATPSPVSSLLDEVKSSISSVREVIRSLNLKAQDSPHELDMKDGISLLSLKHHLLIQYLQSLLLTASRRAIGDSLLERSQPSQPFSDPERDVRGHATGDLVDSMIEGRVVLEKIRVLEGRMRYQIDKLVKISQQKDESTAKDTLNDPLAFRPNPEALMNNADDDDDDGEEEAGFASGPKEDGIYRPPRLAPMPYVPTPTSKEKRAARAPVPKSLSSLLASDPSMPHVESTSGLGNTPSMSLVSSRAKYLQRLNEFEEDQFGRVMMGKTASKRRRRDEEEMALGSGLAGITEDGRGGGATGARWRKGGGWEDEFGDVLRDSGRLSGTRGDGYEELRRRGKKASVLERSRAPKKSSDMDVDVGEKKRKRSRFELERKNIKKKKT